MLDAKKVRLSLALLTGRVVLLVEIGRGTLDSGIYRYPSNNRRTINNTKRSEVHNHDGMSNSCNDNII